MTLSRRARLLWWVPPVVLAALVALIRIQLNGNGTDVPDGPYTALLCVLAWIYVPVVFVIRSCDEAFVNLEPNTGLKSADGTLRPQVSELYPQLLIYRSACGQAAGWAAIAFFLATIAYFPVLADSVRSGSWDEFVIVALLYCSAICLWKRAEYFRRARSVDMFGAIFAMAYFCAVGPIMGYFAQLYESQDGWVGYSSNLGMFTVLPQSVCLWKYFDWSRARNSAIGKVELTLKT